MKSRGKRPLVASRSPLRRSPGSTVLPGERLSGDRDASGADIVDQDRCLMLQMVCSFMFLFLENIRPPTPPQTGVASLKPLLVRRQSEFRVKPISCFHEVQLEWPEMELLHCQRIVHPKQDFSSVQTAKCFSSDCLLGLALHTCPLAFVRFERLAQPCF